MAASFFRAIDEHDVARVESLLAEGADPNEPLDESPHWCPLEAVIDAGVHDGAPPDVVIAIVRVLTRNGANVNSACVAYVKLTPLLAAMAFPDRALAHLLLDHGADPNVSDAFGWTPLMMAARAGDEKLVSSLLAHGAQANPLIPGLAFGALHIAMGDLRVAVIAALLDAGADPYARTQDLDTPLDARPKRSEANAEAWDTIAALVAARDATQK